MLTHRTPKYPSVCYLGILTIVLFPHKAVQERIHHVTREEEKDWDFQDETDW